MSTARVAIAMTAFNRRDITLGCLEDLARQDLADIDLSVWLLDDASPDGTAAAIAARHPDVHLLHGDGECYWSGGMAKVLSAIRPSRPDFVLWMNDDVRLRPAALRRMLDAHAAAERRHPGPNVVVGAFDDPVTGRLAYSGFCRTSRWQPARLKRVAPAPDALVPCGTVNGNLVLMPASLDATLGGIDPVFRHQLGDIDFGYRAIRAGARIWIAPGIMGGCVVGERTPPWRDRTLGLRQRVTMLLSPRSMPPRSWAIFLWRHGGPKALAMLPAIYARTLFSR